MKNISIYDIEYDRLDKIADAHDVTDADIIEALLDAVDNGDIKIEDYL